jgi:RNA polymerase sporulation-specific sigma factor
VVSAWETDFIRRGLVESLSSFETAVLRLYMDGRSYQDIAERLGRHAKSVDNALQRVKRKTEAQLDRARLC